MQFKIIEPELNDKDVTRTLFIGNLDPDVDEIELRKLFDRFGYIEDIDIKRIPNKKPYAFIKYINLDMAHNAKMEMNDKLIGKFEIKIGFGKLLSIIYYYSLLFHLLQNAIIIIIIILNYYLFIMMKIIIKCCLFIIKNDYDLLF